MTSTQVQLMDRDAVTEAVEIAVRNQPVVDMHTHLYPPSFGECFSDPDGLMLWGIDQLLTYHYLIAELFRTVRPDELTPDQFCTWPRSRQAELIWQKLFIERSPVSEACRGVLTTLQALGLDAASRDLDDYRAWFAAQDPDQQIDRVMQAANVQTITMTNDPFDDNERERWRHIAPSDDPRFTAVLRMDPLLVDPGGAAARLQALGYEQGMEGVKRFLRDWVTRMKAVYMAVSLPPSWRFPSADEGTVTLEKAILPVCRELGLPLAMMIGVERQVNPAMRLAGDMGFSADVGSVVRLAAEHPDNQFFITMLSLENQHELAVAARKCGNLMPFGCWWFLNNPSLIEQITMMRLELLGTTFVPQHSDCRVLEQLIYKWAHSRKIISKVLARKYCGLIETGWTLSMDEIERDVAMLLRDNYLNRLSASSTA